MKDAIGYLRVSTQEQGRRGLGLAAHRNKSDNAKASRSNPRTRACSRVLEWTACMGKPPVDGAWTRLPEWSQDPSCLRELWARLGVGASAVAALWRAICKRYPPERTQAVDLGQSRNGCSTDHIAA